MKPNVTQAVGAMSITYNQPAGAACNPGAIAAPCVSGDATAAMAGCPANTCGITTIRADFYSLRPTNPPTLQRVAPDPKFAAGRPFPASLAGGTGNVPGSAVTVRVYVDAILPVIIAGVFVGTVAKETIQDFNAQTGAALLPPNGLSQDPLVGPGSGQILIHEYTSTDLEMQAFQAGSIDMVDWDIPQAYLSAWNNCASATPIGPNCNGQITTSKYSATDLYEMDLNENGSRVASQLSFRQAMGYLVDRQNIVLNIAGGLPSRSVQVPAQARRDRPAASLSDILVPTATTIQPKLCSFSTSLDGGSTRRTGSSMDQPFQAH